MPGSRQYLLVSQLIPSILDITSIIELCDASLVRLHGCLFCTPSWHDLNTVNKDFVTRMPYLDCLDQIILSKYGYWPASTTNVKRVSGCVNELTNTHSARVSFEYVTFTEDIPEYCAFIT